MSLEDVEKLLGEVSDQQQKTIALLDKLAKDAGKPKQRDGWDKFQIVTGFISGVLLAVVGTGFTWLYQNIERHRQDKLQQQQAEVQARQSTFQEVDLVAKFMPYLTGGDDLKRQHAVRTLRLIGDPDMAVQIANEFGGKELAHSRTIRLLGSILQLLKLFPGERTSRTWRLRILTRDMPLPPSFFSKTMFLLIHPRIGHPEKSLPTRVLSGCLNRG